MVNVKSWVLVLALAAVSAMPYEALAIQKPRPVATDNRIQTARYSPNEVYKFVGHYSYQSLIEFQEGEEIQSVAIGDSTAWMVNPVKHRLFIKPIDQEATTNMTVVTNQRVYNFEISASETKNPRDKGMIFVLRFIYPEEYGAGFAQSITNNAVPDLTDPEVMQKLNFDYSIRGVDNIAPIRVFDDGEFTYFQFRDPNADVPAFFLVDGAGNEGLINFRTVGDYIVVERVSARFTLRHGAYVMCIYNEKMTPPPVIKPEAEGWRSYLPWN
jgi:type IV secretion system protein VirB9